MDVQNDMFGGISSGNMQITCIINRSIQLLTTVHNQIQLAANFTIWRMVFRFKHWIDCPLAIANTIIALTAKEDFYN